MNGLKTRGVKDLLLAAVDGLTGFPEAISAVVPKTEVPPCMGRNPVRFVPYKERRAIIAGLKPISLAPRRNWPPGHRTASLRSGTKHTR